jgi:hypothetical protein
MVAGTFLYVSIIETGTKELMMHRELHSKRNHMSAKAVESWKLIYFWLCVHVSLGHMGVGYSTGCER